MHKCKCNKESGCHESGSWSSVHSPPEVTCSPHGLLHYISVARNVGLQFPSSIALTTHTFIAHTQLNTLITQLSPITRLQKNYYTHYIRPTQILFSSPSIVLAFSTILVLAALPSHSVFLYSLQYCFAFITHLVIAALLSLVSCSS